MKPPLFYLILITLFGAIARLWFFWTDGMHVDEKYTIELVQHSLPYIIKFSLTTDCNPPLFYILDWISVSLLGVSAFAERSPSIIAGILLIPAAYYLGKEFRGETLGLLSALAISTLGSMWYYSQFGRTYMLECLLFTVFSIYFVRLVRGNDNTVNWVMLSGFAVLLAYAHLFSIIPISVMIGYLIYQYRLQSVKWLVFIGIFTSPLLLLFKAILTERTVSEEVAKAQWGWYGTPFMQLIAFTPLEFFGYVFIFWVPMIVYSVWKYWKLKEVSVIIISGIIGFIVMLCLSDITPVFSRYMLLIVPVLVVIGLLPVAEFLDSVDHTSAQKWFIIGGFGVFYFAITVFAFWSGLYAPKGTYFL